MSDEFDSEPVPGLPENLPAGETLLWQVSPSWISLARHSFHAEKVAAYFALLSAGRVGWQLASGQSLTASVAGASHVVTLGTSAVALLLLLAWLSSRTTIFSMTNRRIVMRYGIALPMTVNLPFAEIGSADLKTYADGSGDIALATTGPMKLAYFNLWPNVRPWHLKDAQPALRSIPASEDVARLLARALGQVAGGRNAPCRISDQLRPNPQSKAGSQNSTGMTVATA